MKGSVKQPNSGLGMLNFLHQFNVVLCSLLKNDSLLTVFVSTEHSLNLPHLFVQHLVNQQLDQQFGLKIVIDPAEFNSFSMLSQSIVGDRGVSHSENSAKQFIFDL